MESIRGTGMYMTMVYMHMLSQHLPIHCGGTGVIILLDGVGHHTTGVGMLVGDRHGAGAHHGVDRVGAHHGEDRVGDHRGVDQVGDHRGVDQQVQDHGEQILIIIIEDRIIETIIIVHLLEHHRIEYQIIARIDQVHHQQLLPDRMGQAHRDV